MFLLFTDSKQHKARELGLITLRNHARRFFFWFCYNITKTIVFQTTTTTLKRTALYGPRPFSVSLFRPQTIFGLGDALSLVACENFPRAQPCVYGKRQTPAKIKLLPSVFSSLYSRIKIFVFAVNSKRHFSIFV